MHIYFVDYPKHEQNNRFMEDLLLYQQILSLPENLRKELEEFLNSLKKKAEKEDMPKKPHFGSGKGIFKMKEDFDQPLEDFKEYM